MKEEIHGDLIVKYEKHTRKIRLLRETMSPIGDLARRDEIQSAYLTDAWHYCSKSAGRGKFKVVDF